MVAEDGGVAVTATTRWVCESALEGVQPCDRLEANVVIRVNCSYL